jgi:putative oxidoreductase
MMINLTADAATLSTGLLAARLVLGLAMAAHGTQKLFGWFGGYGLKGTAGFFESIGFFPGKLFAGAAALGEIGSGLLVALGLLGPIGPALMVSVMIVAAITVHAKGGFFAAKNGVEIPVLYAVGAFALALIGPGEYSLDSMMGLEALQTATVAWIALGLSILGAVASLLSRRASPVTA